MNTKKLLAAFLSAVMVLGTMALPVFADDTAVVSVKNGETTTDYSDITKAFAAVEDNAVVTYHTEQLQLQYTNLPEKNNVTYTSDYVDGNTKGTLMVYGVGKYNTAFTDITFDGLRFEKAAFGIYGNEFSENLNLNIKNCTFDEAGGNCIYITSKLNSLVVSGCTFNASSESANQYLVWTYDASNVTVKNNIFNGSNTAKGAVNIDKNTKTATVSENTIKGFERGVQIAAASGSVTIENNKFENINVYNDTQKRTAPIFIHKNTDQNAVTVAVNNNEITNSSTAVFGERGTDCISEFKGNTVNGADAGELNDNTATYVAQIGSNYFTTLKDAIDAAQAGDTVELLSDANGDGIIFKSNRDITVDFGGHTYTVSGTLVGSTNSETNCFQLLKDSNITFKNGAIVSSKSAKWGSNTQNPDKTTGANIIIQNYSNLTLKDMTIDGDQSAETDGNPGKYYALYVLSNNNGKIVMTGKTNIKAEKGKYAFDVCRFSTYPSVIVTLDENMTGTIDGNIEISNSNNETVANDKFNLIIKNGTINGSIKDSRTDAQKQAYSKIGEISGGTFSEDVSDYCADGYVPSKNSDGTYSVFVPVAKIGDTSYPTLADAFANVKDGETVTLLNNLTESIKIDNGKDITLDLNGKTLTNEAKKHTIENNGILTVTDSSESKSGVVDNVSHGKAALFNADIATAVLNGGKFMRSQETGIDQDNSGGNSWYTIANQGTLTINSGVTVENKGYFSSNIVTGNYNNKSTADTSKLTINGGTFKGGVKTVKVDECGVLTINDGTFTNEKYACIMNWNKTEIKGGTFTSLASESVWNGRYTDTTAVGELKIAGGTFNGGVENSAKYSGGTISISGGTFKEDVSDYCADGYVSSKNSDGTYSVLVQSKKRDDNTSGGGKVTPVYTNPTYTKDIFGVEHKSHNAYINGYEDGTVKPDGNITREELAAILYRVSNDASTIVASGNKFTDVSADRWSAGAIEFMANKKVVNGYEDGSFKPSNNLTRGEFAAMIARFADLTDTAASRTFSDVDSSYWGFKSVMALNKAGYVNGYEDGTFRPEANVTRAEVMTVINKIIGRSADASYVKSLDNNRFSDLDKNSWYYVDVMEATTDHNYKLNSSGVEIEWSK